MGRLDIHRSHAPERGVFLWHRDGLIKTLFYAVCECGEPCLISKSMTRFRRPETSAEKLSILLDSRSSICFISVLNSVFNSILDSSIAFPTAIIMCDSSSSRSLLVVGLFSSTFFIPLHYSTDRR